MANKKQKHYQFEVLRTGTFIDANGRKVTISQSDLNELSESYDAINSPSPLVAGHPKDNDPALGWADSFSVVGNKLIGFSKKVHKNLSKAVNQGLYKKISLSIYDPDSTSNPVPGKKYIRHVGFLGAAAPAVPGLKTLAFSADESGFTEIELSDVTFSESTWSDKTTAGILGKLREFIIDKFSIEDADKVVRPWEIDSIKESATRREVKDTARAQTTNSFTETSEDTEMTPEEIAALQTNLSEAKTKVTSLETEVADLKQTIADGIEQSRVKDINDFCDQAIKDGNILPADKDRHVQIMSSLPVSEIEFAEGKTSALQLYKDSLTAKKANIDFSEKSRNEKGYQKPEDKLNQVAKIEAHAKEKSMSFVEAAKDLEITA